MVVVVVLVTSASCCSSSGDLRLGHFQVVGPHLQVVRQLRGLVLGIVPLRRRAGGQETEPGSREREQRGQEAKHLVQEAPAVPLRAPAATVVVAVKVTAPAVVAGRGLRLRCCHVSVSRLSAACAPRGDVIVPAPLRSVKG